MLASPPGRVGSKRCTMRRASSSRPQPPRPGPPIRSRSGGGERRSAGCSASAHATTSSFSAGLVVQVE
eukprot:2227223-Prymnesium_polylepis.1